MERVHHDLDVLVCCDGFACGPRAKTCAEDVDQNRACGFPSRQTFFFMSGYLEGVYTHKRALNQIRF